MSEFSLFYATFPDEKTALEISRSLLNERLIACANLLSPMRSLYWWKGQIEESGEIAVIFKATKIHAEALESRFLALHPYETPCLMEIPVDRVSTDYGEWLRDSLKT